MEDRKAYVVVSGKHGKWEPDGSARTYVPGDTIWLTDPAAAAMGKMIKPVAEAEEEAGAEAEPVTPEPVSDDDDRNDEPEPVVTKPKATRRAKK